MARPRRSLALLCALVGLAVLAIPTSASAVERKFFGVQDWSSPTAAQFDKLGQNRVGRVRLTMLWAQVEPTPGARRWDYFDTQMANAARANVELLPVIIASPAWVAENGLNPPMAPSHVAAFRNFVRDAVARYGRNGAFWQSRPELRYKPIVDWQVWNEPNYPAYWNDSPNAGEYVALLAEAAGAIRSVDPIARVVLAGLPETQNGIPATRFLRQIYRVPGAKNHFDAVAINPYARDYRGVMGAVKRARRTMKRNGDGAVKLLITEVGWATAGKVSKRTAPFRTSLKGQAKRLKQTFRALLRNRRRFKIDGVVWFSLTDRARRAGERNWWGINTGLLRANGSRKPAWRVFVRFARR
jgi:hypothetical protein